MVNFKKHIGLNSGFNSTFARRSSGIAPSNTVAPEITGTFEVGETLTCSDGTWTGTEPITYSYQWKRGVTNIGTDSNTYEAVYDDIDEDITCVVTATNDYGSDSEVSNTVLVSITLNYIINFFGFSNAWSSENLIISGTTTTALDYKGVHNLVNPGATNQPTLTTNNVLVKNKPSLNFNTDDYLLKSLGNWNNSETTGCVTFIAKTTTSTNIHALTSCDVGGGNGLNETQNGFNQILFYLRGSTFINQVQTTTSVDTSRFNIVTFYSNGVNYGCYINGISTALSVSIGANDGKWFSLMNSRDNISIGAKVGSTINYATMDWFFSGYSNYTTTTEIEQLHSDLMNYLGL